jgi:hypothetical protein
VADASSLPLLSDRNPSSITPLTIEQRLALITLHKNGDSHNVIAAKIPCSIKSVKHWVNQ